MKRLGLTLQVVHVIALALWVGCVVTAGLAAAIIFPTTKSLRPSLPEYAAYTGDHWMLAAGKVAARIFEATDIAQITAAGVAVLTGAGMLAARRIGWRRPMSIAWLVSLAAALCLLAYQVASLRPRMNADLFEYWRAALAGENAAAEAARLAFSAEHPTASNLMGATALCVLVALAAVIPAAEACKTDAAPQRR